MRLLLACRLGFRALCDGAFARRALELDTASQSMPVVRAVEPPVPPRSEAVELLAVLQREGRLVDFLREPITSYSDAQIGAAVREVHAGCSRAVERIFGLVAAIPEAEGSAMRIAAGQDTSGLRLTGAVTGALPYTGTVQHAGWRATHCTLPAWTGQASAALLVAPAEVEISPAASART